MFNIDTHIIIRENENKEWLDKCIFAITGQPTNVFVVKGVEGNIAKGRVEGFSLGDAEYVSFVDPDDYVEEGVYETINTHLKENPDVDVVFTAERVIDEAGTEISIQRHIDYHKEINRQSLKFVHHLVVARRSIVTPILSEVSKPPLGIEQLLWMHAYNKGAKFSYLNIIGYNWRVHKKNSFKKLRTTKESTEEMRKVLKEIASKHG